MALNPANIVLPQTPDKALTQACLKRFKLTITGSPLGLWRKLLYILSICRTEEHLALVTDELKGAVQAFWLSDECAQLANAFDKENKLWVLETRLTIKVIDVALSEWNVAKTMNRAQKINQMVSFVRSNPRSCEGFSLELRDYLKVAVGDFNKAEFEFRGSKLKVTCDGLESDFSGDWVYAKTSANPPSEVTVANGVYRGTPFPTPEKVRQFVEIVLHPKPLPPTLQQYYVVWVYENLAAASYFDHLWEGFPKIAKGRAKFVGLLLVCPCNRTPQKSKLPGKK